MEIISIKLQVRPLSKKEVKFQHKLLCQRYKNHEAENFQLVPKNFMTSKKSFEIKK